MEVHTERSQMKVEHEKHTISYSPWYMLFTDNCCDLMADFIFSAQLPWRLRRCTRTATSLPSWWGKWQAWMWAGWELKFCPSLSRWEGRGSREIINNCSFITCLYSCSPVPICAWLKATRFTNIKIMAKSCKVWTRKKRTIKETLRKKLNESLNKTIWKINEDHYNGIWILNVEKMLMKALKHT